MVLCALCYSLALVIAMNSQGITIFTYYKIITSGSQSEIPNRGTSDAQDPFRSSVPSGFFSFVVAPLCPNYIMCMLL